jgi:hypothetical protein
MGFFEDMFKSKHGHRHHDSHHFGLYLIRDVFNRIIHNRTLLIFLVMVLILIIIAFIIMVIALLPLLGKFITYINQNGIKGIIEFLMTFINRLWEGGGKA